jgi:hypothetical protein
MLLQPGYFCVRPKQRELQVKLFYLEDIVSVLVHAHTYATCQAVAGPSTDSCSLKALYLFLAHALTSATCPVAAGPSTNSCRLSSSITHEAHAQTAAGRALPSWRHNICFNACTIAHISATCPAAGGPSGDSWRRSSSSLKA